ncbi:hypothetical protein NZK35_06910 [Stieleria sp. ICT_E10.1]|uniref:hypothetical protein n=1 Tax=Stieleria sedimenti TaxID=2976331 RepID=UPI00217FC486|nr:hypothetical protein [Stieleria sedimenti]MCS7466403.1 hypothetical protein [Stieleria sedimenti]
MRRYDESRKDDFDQSLELGRDNQECLDGMNAWCTNVEIARESQGLYAEMSGLPIASHSIGCPHVEHKSSSMNLRWIFSEFLSQHCQGCPHHSPAGDPSWGNEIIASQRKAVEAREGKEADETARISELRANLADQSTQIGEMASPETRELIQFLEQLFSEDASKRAAASQRLVESASLAPELFPDASVTLLITLASTDDHAELTLPTCIALARASQSVRAAMLPMATANIERGFYTELTAELVDALGDTVQYPLSDTLIDSLIRTQHDDMAFLLWHRSSPSYQWHLNALQRSYDADQESVRQAFRLGLQNLDDRTRIRYCGALKRLQRSRPSIAVDLIESIAQSLCLFETNDRGSNTPSAEIVGVLQHAFKFAPDQVDEELASTFAGSRPAVKEDIIRVYSDLLDWDDDKTKEVDDIARSQQIAFGRLFDWVKDDMLELDLRGEAAEALENAASHRPVVISEKFDAILGYLALIVAIKEPPEPPPKIIIPGESEDPRLAGLQAHGRKREWLMLKDRLIRCLKHLTEQQSSVHFDTVAGCLQNRDANVGAELKAVCMTLLGTIGENYQLRSKALPLLMKGLMDYESVWVRGHAIDATCEMFRYSKSPPPSNIIDIMNVHLRDTYTMVHKAAVEVVSRGPRWFDEDQALDAMTALATHLKVYKDDPIQLESICEAILGLARQHDGLMHIAIGLVKSTLPTGESRPDQKIIANLVRTCPPNSPIAGVVSILIAEFLARVRSRRLNGYEHDRKRMFQWLHSLPPRTYQHISNQLLNAAREMAVHDPWETTHFASLFSHFGDFAKENSILDTVRNAIRDEPRHQEFRDDLLKLATVAKGNACLRTGDVDLAMATFASQGDPQS